MIEDVVQVRRRKKRQHCIRGLMRKMVLITGCHAHGVKLLTIRGDGRGTELASEQTQVVVQRGMAILPDLQSRSTNTGRFLTKVNERSTQAGHTSDIGVEHVDGTAQRGFAVEVRNGRLPSPS